MAPRDPLFSLYGGHEFEVLGGLSLRMWDHAMGQWRHTQLRNFIKTLGNRLRSHKSVSRFKAMCLDRDDSTHLLSKPYKLLLEKLTVTTPYYIGEWKKELGRNLFDSSIEKIMSFTHTTCQL